MRKLAKILRRTNTLKTAENPEVSETIDYSTLKNEEIYNLKLEEIKNSYKNLTEGLNEEERQFFEIGYQAITSLDKSEKEYFFYRLLIENKKKEESQIEKIKNGIKKSFFSIRTNFFEKLGSLGNAKNSNSENEQKEEKEEIEEKTIFDVELTSFEAGKKLMVIKTLKTILKLGLKETKEFVEKTPQILREGVKKEEAEELSEKLAKIGCVISIK